MQLGALPKPVSLAESFAIFWGYMHGCLSSILFFQCLNIKLLEFFFIYSSNRHTKSQSYQN